MNAKNILIIRSAARVFNPVLQSLKREFPESKIAVLAPEPVKELLLQDPLVDEVLPLRTRGRMGVFSYGVGNIQRLRDRKFDLAISLYNIERGVGYSNIDLLAWLSGAREVRGYNCKGSFIDLAGSGIFAKYFREKMSAVWVGVNLLVTVVLFFLITVGFIFEWCFRKVFQRNNDSTAMIAPKRKTAKS
ncbi:MAG: glycosyltransferase family 9 protein [Nitrospinales bacterium]